MLSKITIYQTFKKKEKKRKKKKRYSRAVVICHSSKKREARKKKKEAAHAASENHNNNGDEKEMSSTCNISIKDIQMAMEVFNIQQKPAKTQEEAMQKPYQFWSTQPVPKMGE